MRRHLAALASVALLLAAGCSSDDAGGDAAGSDDPSTTTTAADGGDGGGGTLAPIVFSGQGNHLDAYATTSPAEGDVATQRVISSVDDDPDGRDINAQICFFTGPDGERLMIAGEDTGQDDPDRPAGWGIFEVTGEEVGDLEATQVGKLVTTFQPTADNPENYGCGVLPDGRVLTTDVGSQATGDGDGQLTIWFPPLTGGTLDDFDDVAHCKIDVELATGQSILVRGDEVLVAAARGGVYRYPGPFPTSADADGGCGGQDATGAPMADDVVREVLVAPGEDDLATPAGLADAPDGGLYVSSVFNGVINEYDGDGTFRRTVLRPPEGEELGEEPYSTGTPLGIAVTPDGTLYYADIGIVFRDGDIGPGPATGTVRRLAFVDGQPQPPEVVADGLAFPDGIGILVPG